MDNQKYTTVAVVPHPTLPWVAEITTDSLNRTHIKFYNTRNGAVTGPWMGIPVLAVDGAWSLGDRDEFQSHLDEWLRAISSTLTEKGIDHLGCFPNGSWMSRKVALLIDPRSATQSGGFLLPHHQLRGVSERSIP